MKFGIKLWSTNENLIKIAKVNYLDQAFDFIELTAKVDTFDKKIAQNLKNIPTTIHCDNDNVNFYLGMDFKNNLKAINESIKYANFLNSKYIIFHPGYISEKEKKLNKILKKFDDPRFCIENMPGRRVDINGECYGRTYEEIRKIYYNHFCLDIAHAIKSAIYLKKDIYQNIENLLKLNPKIIHISDGMISNNIDEHLNIEEGEFDFYRIFKLIGKKERYIVSETPKKTFDNLDNDIKNIEKIKNIFSTL